MGYYKQKLIEEQEKVDDIIRWWKSHENQTMPHYLLQMIVEDERFFDKVLAEWEQRAFASWAQSIHETSRRAMPRKRKRDWSMSHADAVVVLTCFAFVSIIGTVLAIALAVTL